MEKTTPTVRMIPETLYVTPWVTTSNTHRATVLTVRAIAKSGRGQKPQDLIAIVILCRKPATLPP